MNLPSVFPWCTLAAGSAARHVADVILDIEQRRSAFTSEWALRLQPNLTAFAGDVHTGDASDAREAEPVRGVHTGC